MLEANTNLGEQLVDTLIEIPIDRPRHGGDLREVSTRYDIGAKEWLDLSTGINPNAYPVEGLPQSVWQQLPSEADGLNAAASHYYNSENVLMVPGSQWAISSIPRLISDLTGGEPGCVLLPSQGYREHAYAWQNAGFSLRYYEDWPTDEQLRQCDICVVINPNNPTGFWLQKNNMCDMLRVLQDHNALLIVDEAFVDSRPEFSMTSHAGEPNLVVLRSIGKFFGLAGIRVGAVCAWPEFLSALSVLLPPWAIPGPSRLLAESALADAEWIAQTKQHLQQEADALDALLYQVFNRGVTGTDLFRTVYLLNAEQVFEGLCQQGIYTRLLDDGSGLRFGLPKNAEAFIRLGNALMATCLHAVEEPLSTLNLEASDV